MGLSGLDLGIAGYLIEQSSNRLFLLVPVVSSGGARKEVLGITPHKVG